MSNPYFPPQYYFNSVTQVYMFWDSKHSTYLPAPTSEQDQETTTKESNATGSEEKIDDDVPQEGRKDKNKMAKKVSGKFISYYIVFN